MLDDDTPDDIHPLFHGAPKTTEFRKLRKRLVRQTREAIERYGMVEPGTRWLVCLSGGKDSYTLLAALYELQWRGLLPVELLACNLDQGQPGFPATVLPEFLERMGVPHRIEYQDTYSVVTDKIPQNNTYCSLCSRLRRGHLYRIAREGGTEITAHGLGEQQDGSTAFRLGPEQMERTQADRHAPVESGQSFELAVVGGPGEVARAQTSAVRDQGRSDGFEHHGPDTCRTHVRTL